MFFIFYTILCIIVFNNKYSQFINYATERNNTPIGDDCFHEWHTPKLITPLTLFCFPVILIFICLHIYNCRE